MYQFPERAFGKIQHYIQPWSKFFFQKASRILTKLLFIKHLPQRKNMSHCFTSEHYLNKRYQLPIKNSYFHAILQPHYRWYLQHKITRLITTLTFHSPINTSSDDDSTLSKNAPDSGSGKMKCIEEEIIIDSVYNWGDSE